jgi:PAS domain-containing protein
MPKAAQINTDPSGFTEIASAWSTGNWPSLHAWLYILSDLFIFSAFLLIPVVILVYVYNQGKRIRFSWFFALFASFLLVTGCSFLIDALMFWVPAYDLNVVFRLSAGVLSWLMIFFVIKLLPIGYSLKSPHEFQLEIEKRVRAEQEIRVKNERLMEAEYTAKLGYGYWDIARERVELSEMASEILGVSYNTILNYDTIISQIHPADLKFVEECMRKNLEADKFQEFYFRIVTPEMAIRHVLIKGEVVRNALGKPIMIKGTIQDVSQLRRQMIRIENQNRRLRKIAWVQSHRMRSPVATILGMVELFNFEDPADPMNAEILNNVKELTDKLDGIIHEVDELTRTHTGATVENTNS